MVDSRETIGRVLSHVWCHVEVPHVSHEIGRIEAFVGAHREALGARRITHDHVIRGLALGMRKSGAFCSNDELPLVLGHDVARISELCLLALAFFGKLSLGVHSGGMRLVAALFAVKIALAVASRGWRLTRTAC